MYEYSLHVAQALNCYMTEINVSTLRFKQEIKINLQADKTQQHDHTVCHNGGHISCGWHDKRFQLHDHLSLTYLTVLPTGSKDYWQVG